MGNKSLNSSIISIRVKLQNAKLKKTGKNKFAGFTYFELADFLPKLNELMLEEEINDKFYIKDGYATLELVKGEEVNTYTIPFVIFDTPLNWKENKLTGQVEQVKSMQDIQYLGALNTYYKRYLYINAFGITDGELIDSMNNDEIEPKEKNATPGQLSILNKLSEETKTKIINANNINSLEELTINQASSIIARMKKKEV